MEITQLRHTGYDVNVRVNTPWLDMNVLTEVIGNDSYRLHELKDVMGMQGVEVKTILDVGGHIGSFGLLAKTLWPQAKLIAIEPNPDNARLYRMNLQSNRMNGMVIQAAIGYGDATCLVHSPSTTGGHVMRTREEADQYVQEGYRFYNAITDDKVRLVTVSEICKEHGIDHFDLAKWDCEGGEIDAFQNMTEQESEVFRFMVGEYHIWSEENKYLKADLFASIRFWKAVKKKFRHLNFDYTENRLGLFAAWPKG